MALRWVLVAAAAAATFGAVAAMSDLTAGSYQCCAGSSACSSGSEQVGCNGDLIYVCCPDGTSPSHSCNAYGLECTCSKQCGSNSQIIINYSTNNGKNYATTAIANGGTFSMTIKMGDYGVASFMTSTDDDVTVVSTRSNSDGKDPIVSVYFCDSPSNNNNCLSNTYKPGFGSNRPARICTGPYCGINPECTGPYRWLRFRYDNQNGIIGNKVTVDMKITRSLYTDIVCNPPTPSPTATILPPNATVLPPNATVLPPNATLLPTTPPPLQGDANAPPPGLPTSSIVGIVLCVVIVVLAAGLVTVIVLRKKRAAAANAGEYDPLVQPKGRGAAPEQVSYH